METLNRYEIHFMHHGVKKVVVCSAAGMTDIDAWMQATLASNISASALPHARFLSLTITAAENQGVTKVRWNLSPKAGPSHKDSLKN